jgi:hypothetical protein
MRAKNASEILDDATLTTWQSFDNPSSYSDSGPLHLKVTAVNVTSVNGRVNQAITFTSNSSYYQVRKIIDKICKEALVTYRLMDLFCSVFRIIRIPLRYGLVHHQFEDQLLFIFRQQPMVKDGVLI